MFSDKMGQHFYSAGNFSIAVNSSALSLIQSRVMDIYTLKRTCKRIE